MHEVMHVLCFDPNLFPLWINPQTHESYGKNFPFTTKTYLGKTFSVIHTPNIQKWSIQRFGNGKWHDIPPGLEVEDDGGEGTRLAHPEQTIYWPDFMVGYSEIGQKNYRINIYLPIRFWMV